MLLSYLYLVYSWMLNFWYQEPQYQYFLWNVCTMSKLSNPGMFGCHLPHVCTAIHCTIPILSSPCICVVELAWLWESEVQNRKGSESCLMSIPCICTTSSTSGQSARNCLVFSLTQGLNLLPLSGQQLPKDILIWTISTEAVSNASGCKEVLSMILVCSNLPGWATTIYFGVLDLKVLFTEKLIHLVI